ncbi:unnamed protein product [Meganyctiphanes norvegica]|uniref:Uncharacterized protein n=1 Tax=Meganyctiphanes norvegica TaxID=48144 RepID=A0AAV2RVI6_MEGNR
MQVGGDSRCGAASMGLALNVTSVKYLNLGEETEFGWHLSILNKTKETKCQYNSKKSFDMDNFCTSRFDEDMERMKIDIRRIKANCINIKPVNRTKENIKNLNLPSKPLGSMNESNIKDSESEKESKNVNTGNDPDAANELPFPISTIQEEDLLSDADFASILSDDVSRDSGFGTREHSENPSGGPLSLLEELQAVSPDFINMIEESLDLQINRPNLYQGMNSFDDNNVFGDLDEFKGTVESTQCNKSRNNTINSAAELTEETIKKGFNLFDIFDARNSLRSTIKLKQTFKDKENISKMKPPKLANLKYPTWHRRFDSKHRPISLAQLKTLTQQESSIEKEDVLKELPTIHRTKRYQYICKTQVSTDDNVNAYDINPEDYKRRKRLRDLWHSCDRLEAMALRGGPGSKGIPEVMQLVETLSTLDDRIQSLSCELSTLSLQARDHQQSFGLLDNWVSNVMNSAKNTEKHLTQVWHLQRLMDTLEDRVHKDWWLSVDPDYHDKDESYIV